MQGTPKKNIQEILECGSKLAQKFFDFNRKGISPYHVVNQLSELCKSKNLIHLEEDKPWKLEPGKSYFLTRGGFSSFVAFHVPKNLSATKTAVKIFGTHSDSPCIRLAPKFKHESYGFEQACVQMYGGGLWHTWLDRDLVLGGRVIVREGNQLKYKLYHSEDAIAKVPTLAIHLQKDRSKLEINKETDMRPLIAANLLKDLANDEGTDKTLTGLQRLLANKLGVNFEDIVDFDLCFADSVPPSFFGLNKEFISAARIDNQYSVFCSVEAFLEYLGDQQGLDASNDISITAVFDHEEIGSQTYVGADSSFMVGVIDRIIGSLNISQEKDIIQAILARSILVSADMAHSIHPNFGHIHQKNHTPEMNKGVVLKINCNGRYTTDALSGSVIKNLAKKGDIPLMEFIVSNESPCGSTIGPLLASKLGCLAVDIGAPQLGMHSIRETAGVLDFWYYKQLFLKFMQTNLADELPTY